MTTKAAPGPRTGQEDGTAPGARGRTRAGAVVARLRALPPTGAARREPCGPVRPEYPWLLPSAVADLTPARRARRTVRDWLVDGLCFLSALLVGVIGLDTLGRGASHAEVLVDVVLGLLACCALWVRRRAPLGLALVLMAVGLFSETSGGAILVSLFTLTVHRPFRYVAWVGSLTLLLVPPYYLLRPDPDLSVTGATAFVCVMVGTVIGWGMFVRARRQLVLSLRDRAARAEAEAALRAEHAQRLAREEIAREMHDVLAHRLSLLSVHAGALEFRPDAPRPEVRRAAGVIRDSAHEALQDLRQIIGVLRAGEEGGDPERPQPTLAALARLTEESRAAGADVDLAVDLAGRPPDTVPAATGRTAYRIVQEALTNARKHAPGAPVTCRVHGRPGEGLTVEIANTAPPGAPAPVPGSGQGLIGLRERAVLAGGRLEHGPAGNGGFRLTAWLPWPA
ncbi:histidine kinase [Streptomyces sp. NPDC047046]|uniref:histidine kinase n=1 Tax=Streptomyces sp. NPDC047046 TaxID=3155378 RepID=UPI0033FFF322